MSFHITLAPSQHRFVCETEETVLRAALAAGFNLPYGCRNGACGACKGRVLSGVLEHGDYRTEVLSDEEAQAGFVLFCCAYPRSDLLIESREIGAVRDLAVKRMPCRVEKMERVAEDVMILYVRLPANERLQFLAGQYIDVLLKDGARRSFSLANAPHDDELLQLHVRWIPGGRFTEHVFNTMKPRDILRIEGPLGSFFLREESNKPIVFVAGGTGFAPIKALVEHALEIRIQRPLVIYWGARNGEGLYMNQLAERWAVEHVQAVRYVPVLSAISADDQWNGRTGLVHEAVMADIPDLSGHQVYACGAPEMIDAARRDFTERCKLPHEEFFADSFSFAVDKSPLHL